MNNKIIMGVVAVIVLIAAAYFLMGQKPSTETLVNGAPVPAAAATQKTSGTLGALLTMGSAVCDVTMKTDEIQGTATIYVSGGKMRNEITANGPQGPMKMNMISDTKYVYTWGDAMPQGIKMPIPEGEAAAEAGPAQGYDPNTPIEYSCKPWVEDASKFAPPSSVQFMEMGASPAMPKGVNMPKNIPQLQ